MAFLGGLRRLTPLLVGGAAAAWYLRRQGLLGGQPEIRLPQRPEEPERAEAEPIEAHVEAVEAVSDAADVTAVVEDLLAVAPGEEQEIADAELVEDDDERGSQPPAG